MQRLRTLVVFGTRPEAIKLYPLIRLLREANSRFEPHVCCTGQHVELISDVSRFLDLSIDSNLGLMKPGQSLSSMAGALLPAIDGAIEDFRPDLTLVQGDTTTAFCAGLASFHRGIPIGHVEAGLRSGNLLSPFPEEMNRRLVDEISRWRFAPTQRSHDELVREGRTEGTSVVGNTVVDAIRIARERLDLASDADRSRGRRRRILVTVHRRDNFGDRLKEICRAIGDVVQRRDDTEIVWPLHPNPNVKPVVEAMLGGIPRIELGAPLSYEQMLRALAGADLVVTDSGGLQEEAPSFHVPVLVMRDETERPEGIAAGVSKLVGVNRREIVENIVRLLDDDVTYRAMMADENPYGDGFASERILDIIHKDLTSSGTQTQRFTSESGA
jgi:UDP-N-acetylglucosamine 2-epimerase (non-hydrolysing)